MWGVEKEQVHGPAQTAFTFMRLSASPVKRHCSQLPELGWMGLAVGHRRGTVARESEEGGSLVRTQLPQCG